MEIVFNEDSSFFEIESEDLKAGASTKRDKKVTAIIEDDVISFTVNEELGKLTRGSLLMRDEYDVYSRIFRNGMRLNLTWGYKRFSPGLINGSRGNRSIRTGLKCVIQQPSGGGDANAEKTYSVTFYGSDILAEKKHEITTAGTKFLLITKLMYILDIRFHLPFLHRENNYIYLHNIQVVLNYQSPNNIVLLD